MTNEIKKKASADAIKRANKNYDQKRKENMTAIRIPKDLHMNIKDRAQQIGMSMIEFIKHLLAKE